MTTFFWITGVLAYLSVGFFLVVAAEKFRPQDFKDDEPPVLILMFTWPIFLAIAAVLMVYVGVQDLFNSFVGDPPAGQPGAKP